MRFFSSIVSSCKDLAGKLRQISASASDIDIENRQLIQQFGFISVPPKGSKVLFLQHGSVTIGISSDSDDRPSIEEGDSALYRNANHFIHLKKDGSIDIKAAAGVNVDCDIVSTGNVTDHTSSLDELRQDFEAFVQSYNMHFHVCAAPSSPSGPPKQPPAPPEI